MGAGNKGKRMLRAFVPRAVDDTLFRLRLVAALILDPRVKAPLKAIPLLPLIYLVLPDLLPGPVDDAALLWMGINLFVRLCPAQVVAEHTHRLHGVIDVEQVERQEQAGERPTTPP
jgi:uncharacterized membrane protein